MSTEVLVIGEAGQLGRELVGHNWPDGVSVYAPDLTVLDLTDLGAAERIVRSRPWRAIINAAAYTAVDKAESEPELAWALNAIAPARLAHIAAETATPFIHVSTDYVFRGDKKAPYETDDPIGPLSVYGASKAAGEIAVLSAAPHAVIVRTAWLYSRFGTNFVKTMLRLASERDQLRVVSDQIGSPTCAKDLAAALARIVLIGAHGGVAPGLYHFVNAGQASWWEFASAIFERAAQHGIRSPSVEPIPTDQYPTPAVRPKNSVLSTKRIEAALGISPRDWREPLNEVVDALCKNEVTAGR
jgi:dTDP-4-dehydrorhamnose reductase